MMRNVQRRVYIGQSIGNITEENLAEVAEHDGGRKQSTERGWEHCAPAHSFGPAARNHYIFHYVISGTGTLMADNSAGETITYQVKSGQGFMLFRSEITTYL